MSLRLGTRCAWMVALACAAWGGVPASRAWAETVRLRSGTAYEASSVEVKGETLVLRLALGAGSGTASFPFASIHPGDLARIVAARTADHDAPGQLRIARLALAAGSYAEAQQRAQRAAQLDPVLGAAATDVVGSIRGAQAREALVEIELDLRLRHPLAARERARALLDAGIPVMPPEAEAARARLLLALAEGLLAPAPALADAPMAAAAPAPPPGIAAPPSALGDAALLAGRARALREQAADPALAAPQREGLLSAAAVDLLDARRLLLALPVTAAPDLGLHLEQLRELLLATWLDLADLARGAGAPGIALDRVQAALVLDPESPRAWDLRRWIEGDLTRPFLAEALEPPVWFSPGYFGSRFLGRGCLGSGFLGSGCGGPGWGLGSCAPACAGPYASGFRLHIHSHSGSGAAGGAHHNAGRRR